jgi:4-hydroxy-tetrahydrodipicolinate synthase
VKRLAKRRIDAGVHFLVPCGTTGESPTLTEDERVRVVEFRGSLRSRSRLAGSGGYDTKEVIHSARRMKQAGATACYGDAITTNRRRRPLQHYSAIAGDVGVPIIVYNVPGRTG